VVYFNNGAPAGGLTPFYVKGNANGTWNEAVAQGVVSEFPNWGKFTIQSSELDTTGLLIFRFGSNISNPQVYNATMGSSDYYDEITLSLRVLIKQVQMLSNKTGEIISVRQLSSGRFGNRQ
jgi:hypothetical protein